MNRSAWYPESIRTWRYDGKYPGATWASPDKAVIHSTEGWTLPTYQNGATAPNMTLVPDFRARRFTYYQHYPFTMSARALRNQSGGVETNTDRVVQFEIVGTCERRLHNSTTREHLYMPELPGWALSELGELMEWFNHEHGIPFQAPGFKSYERLSPGVETVRLRNAQWEAFTGWCGHQHVPENTHLDPGNIDIATIITYAKAFKDDRNMPTPKEIAEAVFTYPITNRNPGSEDTKTTLANIVADIEATQDRVNTAIIERLDAILSAVKETEK